MRSLPRSDCHRHLDELLAFADHRDVSAVGPTALVHLETCADCRREVEQTALTVIALRRLGTEAAAAEPSADGWPRLRARLGRPAPWRWRAPMAGLLVSAGLVAVVLAPVAWLRPPTPYIQEVGLEASVLDARRAAEDRSEAEALRQQLALRARPSPGADVAATPTETGGPRLGPDGLPVVRDAAPAVAADPRHE